MYKYLVVILALCLISVLAIEKRDAEENIADKIQKQFQDIGNNIKEFLNPEAVKAGFNDMIDSVNKVLQPAKEEAKQ